MPGIFCKCSLIAAVAALLLGSAAHADTIALRGARVLTMEQFIKGAKVCDRPPRPWCCVGAIPASCPASGDSRASG